MTVRFSPDDVAHFAAWSKDRNPLHVDERFGRQTHFGHAVVHGVLSALATLRAATSWTAHAGAEFDLEFRHAVVPGADYNVRDQRDGDETVLSLEDSGGQRVLTLRARVGSLDGEALSPAVGWLSSASQRPPRQAPTSLTLDDLEHGLEVTGAYATDVTMPFAAVTGATDTQVRVLALFSYLVGMELPGLKSLFTRATVRFVGEADIDHELCYRARTRRFDRDLRLLDIDVDVATPAGRPVAVAAIRSYVPFSPAVGDLDELASRLDAATSRLRGKVAVVMGGTGGLGAEISATLALAGCQVYAIARHDDETRRDRHRQLMERGGKIEFLQGDCGDLAWCQSTLEHVRSRHGTIDLLVLNACAPPPLLRLGPSTAALHASYVTDNLTLVRSPLIAFSEALEQSAGAVVYVSSSAVERPPPGWSHYVAVKQAGEGLVGTVANERPGLCVLVARPAALQTRWSDTPSRAAGSIPADWAASEIDNRLAGIWEPGRRELLTEFPPPRATRPSGAAPADTPSFAIRLSASFTGDPLATAIRDWTKLNFGGAAVEVAPYGQQLQSLLDPGSLLHASGRGCSVLLLRVCDWLRELPVEQVNDIEFVRAHLQRTARDFADALRTYRARPVADTLLVLCPSLGPRSSAESILLRQAEEGLVQDLADLPGLQLMKAASYHASYFVNDDAVHDELRDEIAHIPYRDEYLQVLASIVARRVYRLTTPVRKVVVVDCDNTLWRGVVGEVGAAGVVFESGHRALHETLVRLTREGVLVCLCSKNDEADVWDVFETRADLLLRREHIVAAAINWQLKSQNIRQLARTLNLGLDSFVFIDDNPVECAEVRAACPEVLTIQWPERPEDGERMLQHVWEFDAAKTTSEDARRTQLYREEFQRREARAGTLTFKDFIDTLGLVVDVSPLESDDIRRASQLTLRTNQFNFTTIRRDETELRALMDDGRHEIRTVRVRDRFGDYGLVGLVIVERSDANWNLDTFLLSCRVLGRGAEYRIMAEIGEMAAAAGARAVTLRVEPTARNLPARAFLDSIAAEGLHRGPGDRLTCEMPAGALAAVRFEPGAAAEVVVEDDVAPVASRPVDVDYLRRRESQIARSVANPLAAVLPDREGERPRGAPDLAPIADADVASVVYGAFAAALRLPVGKVQEVDQLEALGCDSLRIVEITVTLSESFPWLPRTLLFEHRLVSQVVAEISRRARPDAVGTLDQPASRVSTPAGARVGPAIGDIAVVGMDVRCAGANSPGELWDLLAAKRSAVKPVPPDREHFLQLLRDSRSHWAGLLEGVSGFDAEFFGVSPREAEFMDPQLRLFLEVAWGALEDAGCAGARHEPNTGVYAGVMYGDYGVRANQVASGTNNPYRCWEGFSLANRLSQLLDFHGPSLAVDTACSSSGTALHLACQALQAGECQVALVGGVNLILDPARFGALGRLGILSGRGRCEPFGADADGTVLGEGAGVVILRPLADAQAHGDRVYGVIKGTALSTGSGTVGFTAPNPHAQAEAIRKAVKASGVDPRTITYVETHGTGTALGDPIEVRGLSLGYDSPELRDPSCTLDVPCAIGSIKPNIGHLEAGAGVLGLIKVLLQLQHGQRLPTISSALPNPQIPFEAGRFVLQRELGDWPRAQMVIDGRPVTLPRRAGVSSFGVGGANAHVVVEEAPQRGAGPRDRARPRHVLALSARTAAPLQRQVARLLAFLDHEVDASIADVCHSVAAGRRHFGQRLAVTAVDRDDLVRALTSAAGRASGPPMPTPPRIAFLFTGQGSQYAGMGRALYDSEPVFRRALDRSAALFDSLLERSLLEVLFAPERSADAALLDQTAYTQPALFAFEYALAELWQSWGVRPDAVLGHSVGEITAMCVAGGMSLEDGLTLIAARGRLMQALPAGGVMASVMAEESRVLEAIAGAEDRVAIAAVNAPGHIVISGAGTAVAEVAARLTAEGIKTKPLTVSHAFHSPLMRPMLDDYRRVVQTIALSAPRLPFVSGVDGTTVSHELTRAEYWVRQVMEPVRFASGMRTLGTLGITACVEIGPHPVLLAMGRQCLPDEERIAWLPSLKRGADEWQTLLGSVASWYERGGNIDWDAFNQPHVPRRISVPTYAFTHRDYWLKHAPAPEPATLPLIRRSPRLYGIEWRARPHGETATRRGHWIVFTDRTGVGDALADELGRYGSRITRVVAGDAFGLRAGNTFQINPADPEDYERLWRAVGSATDEVPRAIHLWNLDGLTADRMTAAAFEAGVVGRVTEAAYLVQTLHAKGVTQPSLWIVTRGAVAADPGPSRQTFGIEGAALWGFGRSVALEHPELWGGLIDVTMASPADAARAIARELVHPVPDDQVALTERGRLVARLVARPADQAAESVTLPADGVYLVTGGVGALGLAAAQWLVEHGARHIMLASRRAELDEAGRQKVKVLEVLGAVVETQRADVSRPDDLDDLLAAIAARGTLRGIVHAAGIDVPAPIRELSAARVRDIVAGKATGAWLLHDRTRGDALDVFICFSSMAAAVGAQSRAHYAAANACLDALMAERRRLGLAATSVAWGPWLGGGMATADALREFERIGNHALEPAVARAALDQAVASGAAHTVVADVDWPVFRQALEARRPHPLLDELEPPPVAPSVADAVVAPWIERLRTVPAASRERELASLLRRELAETMGFDDEASVPVDRNFYEIGVDSLMMADLVSRLRSRTGVAASALVFNHPNVSALAGHLLPQLPLAQSAADDLPTDEDRSSTSVEDLQGVLAEPEILEFQAEAFPDRQPSLVPSRWRWMFIDSARRLGVESRFWIHRVDGRIVGQMGSIPVRLLVSGDDVSTGWLVDTMVLEPYRHLAIGARLMLDAHDDQPFSLSLGQTAEMREIQFRLGWTQVAPLQIAQLLVRPENVLKGKLPAPAAWAAGLGMRASSLVREWRSDAPSLTVHAVDRFGERHDALWRESSRDLTCAVIRDASYLNWKYVDQPGQRFVRLDVRDGDALVGAVVWMLREPDGLYRYRRAFLVDLVTPLSQSARLRQILSVASAEASRWDVDALLCHHADDRLTQALGSCGFHLRRPERYLLVDPGGLAPEQRAAVLAPQSWFVTHGDSDIDRP